MILKKKWTDYTEELGYLSILFMMIGLLYSRAMLSTGMMGLPLALIIVMLTKKSKVNWKHPAFAAVASIFLIYTLTLVYSENMTYAIGRIRMKVPFLFLSFTFLIFSQNYKKYYYHLLYGFLALISLSALISFGQYLWNFEAINAHYDEGRILPTPIQHIRYSLMVVYAFCIAWIFLEKRYILKYNWERWIFIGLLIFIGIYLHILAVRSGLLAWYLVVFYFIIRYVYQSKKWGLAIGVISAMIIGLVLAVQYVPTLKSKFDYTRYSLYQMENKLEIRELSDSRRIASILGGLDTWKQHPLFGVGVGDVKQATEVYLSAYFPSLVNLGLLPHNQWVWIMAACGSLGLIAFVIATTYYSFLYKKAYRYPLIVSFHLILWSSFITEHTLETQLGTGFYILFTLMGIRYLDFEAGENDGISTKK